MEQEIDTELRHSRQILVVDDDEGLRQLIVRQLKRCGFDAAAVATGAEAVGRAASDPQLFLLLDLKLNDMTGSEVVTSLRNRGCSSQFMVMTGQGDEKLAVEMMKLGASDYLVKDTDFLDRLPGVIDRVFRALHTEKQLENAKEEKLKLQEQLIQSQKMDAIGQLAGGVAHDFNNILGGILGAAELLYIDQNMPVLKRKEFLELIINTAKRGAGLTRQLLTFSRKGLGTHAPVNCADVITEAVAILRQTIDKTITITINYNQCASSEIIGDPSLLESVFLNLGINASHAMQNGGSLTFTLSNRELDQTDTIHGQFKLAPGSYLSVAVEDTGCGMSAEVKKHIFEPFFTTKEQGKGTGLGLSAVYGAVRAHNGAVTIYSEEGTGTIVTLYFPLTKNPRQAGTTAEHCSVRGTGTVLIVDDEEIIRRTAKAILESLGYQAITASDGREGLEILKSRGDEIDLILLDMIMPVMGGRETFKQMRHFKPDLKILVSSGFSQDTTLSEMKTIGLNGFIRKPYNQYELSHAVAEILNPGSEN